MKKRSPPNPTRNHRIRTPREIPQTTGLSGKPGAATATKRRVAMARLSRKRSTTREPKAPLTETSSIFERA